MTLGSSIASTGSLPASTTKSSTATSTGTPIGSPTSDPTSGQPGPTCGQKTGVATGQIVLDLTADAESPAGATVEAAQTDTRTGPDQNQDLDQGLDNDDQPAHFPEPKRPATEAATEVIPQPVKKPRGDGLRTWVLFTKQYFREASEVRVTVIGRIQGAKAFLVQDDSGKWRLIGAEMIRGHRGETVAQLPALSVEKIEGHEFGIGQKVWFSIGRGMVNASGKDISGQRTQAVVLHHLDDRRYIVALTKYVDAKERDNWFMAYDVCKETRLTERPKKTKTRKTPIKVI